MTEPTRPLWMIQNDMTRLRQEAKAAKPGRLFSPGFKRDRSLKPSGEGQRQPRVRDTAHLQFIRRLPCVATYARTGAQVFGCDAAHVRFGDPARGKRHTGMAEKPDDKWCVPLTRAAHTEQHGQSERAFWSALGIDPIALCEALYAVSGDEAAAVQIIRGGRHG